MGAEVTFTEACRLLDVSPKTGRRWLQGTPSAARESDRRVKLYDKRHLASIARSHGRSGYGLLRRVESHQADGSLSEIREQLAALASRVASLESREYGRGAQSRPVSTTDSTTPPSSARGGTAPGGGFRTHADAARWLLPHGVHSAHTPKTWPGWQGVELSPHAVLAFALALEQRWAANHRRNWSLHRCGQPGCVCAELLEAPGHS